MRTVIAVLCVALAACGPAAGPPPPPPGFVLDNPPPVFFVPRGRFGGCPTGYVDHPADPDQCALPAAAERLLARARR